MEHVDVVPTPAEFAWTFGGASPLRTLRPGTLLTAWSEDAFSGQLRGTADVTSAQTFPGLNPQTGPFFVEGAEPGDTLVLHLVDLRPARSHGVSSLVPFFGGLTSTDRTATLQPALPERTWVYEVDTAAGTVGFVAGGEVAGGGDWSVALPLEPMLGTVGVAPAAGEVRTSLVPDVFGGNLDTPEMRVGTTVYLRVNVPGALFSLGDGHYRQGEGESCGTAVEGAMHSTLLVDLVKGSASGGGPAWPRLEDDEFLMVVGSGRPLEDAWRAGQVDAVAWIADLTGLDTLDAYQLLSQISRVPLANVVDANYSCVTKIPKRFLRGAPAYGGVHADLRARARGL
ncbi:acetamidase/formamidase family protein [Kineococcus gynurae]|uniref:Acetamidase/formamidase family protein n=1 Tax=Kineococcus gynurae TaxID=452979 RepID=A0ABV5LUP4_9ACTN